MKHFSFVTHPRLRLGVLCAAILCAGGASYAGGLQLRYSSYAREGNYRVDWGYGIACSAAGHIGITGSFNLPDTRLGVILLKGSLPSNTLYASYFGANDSAMGSNMAFDRQTNVWLTGSARGTTFYVTPNAYQPTNAGPLGTWDAVVMKIDPRRPTGNGSVLYSTYLGGSGSPDYGQAIAVDKQGNAYVAGFVYSTNLRTTPNAYQTTNAGPPNTYEAMFAKFDSTGGVVFVSYLGGLSHDKAHGIAVDDSGNIYVMGATQSANFPVTANAYQSTKGAGWDLFLTKFDSTGRNMLYSTFLGGTGTDGQVGGGIAVDPAGKACIVSHSNGGFPVKNAYQSAFAGGIDAVFAEIDTTLSGAASLIFSTYFGGSGQECYNGSTGEFEGGIAMDGSGNICLGGSTTSPNLPTKVAYQNTLAGGVDAFVASFSPDGATLRYSSYHGGTGDDRCRGIAVGPDGAVYLTGQTKSTDFPCTPDAARNWYDGWGDVFIVKAVTIPFGTMCMFQ